MPELVLKYLETIVHFWPSLNSKLVSFHRYKNITTSSHRYVYEDALALQALQRHRSNYL